jgi:putative endonuclease
VPDTSHLGERGEETARGHLSRAGYKILETNFMGRAGEIDIVAREGGDIVFVEVRARGTAEYGLPSATVNEAKWRRLRRTADQWLRERRLEGSPMRYDIVSIVWPRAGEPQIEVIRGVLPEGRFLPRRGRGRRRG